MTTDTSETGYVPIDGLNIYYEIHGKGQPLVLLHGGLTTIDTSFGTLLPTLASSYRVIATEQQGHGHTADLDRPMTFAKMADDTAAVLEHLSIEDAYFCGYSDGGNVGLGVAIRHPQLVRELTVVGTNFDNNGLIPGTVDNYKSLDPDALGELRDVYIQVAPKPEAWPRFVKKVMQMVIDFPGWDIKDIRAIVAPTLIVIGDADIVCPEHAVEMYRLLPEAKLAVFPNTGHELPLSRSEWLLSMLTEFFDKPIAKVKTE